MQDNFHNLALVDMDELSTGKQFVINLVKKWDKIIGAGTALASTVAGAFNPLLGLAVGVSGALISKYTDVGDALEENWGYWMPMYDNFITELSKIMTSREDIIKFCLKYSAFIKTEADVSKGQMVTSLNESLINKTLPQTLKLFQNAKEKFPLLLNTANLAGGIIWKKYYNSDKKIIASKDDLLLVEALRFFTYLTKTDFPITRLPITLNWPLSYKCVAACETYAVDKIAWNFPFNVMKRYKNRKGKYAKKTFYEWQKTKKIWNDLNMYDFIERAYYTPWITCSSKIKPCGGEVGAHMLVDNLNNFKDEHKISNSDSQIIHNKINLTFTNYFRETLDIDTFFDYIIWDNEVINKHDWMFHHIDCWENCPSYSSPASAIIPIGWYPLFIDPYDLDGGTINYSPLVDRKPRGGFLKLTGNPITDKNEIWNPLRNKVNYLLDIYKTMDETIYNPQVGKASTIIDERKATQAKTLKDLLNLSTTDKKNYLIYGGIVLSLFAAYRIMR